MQEKRVLKIKEFSSAQFSDKWFGLGFTGVGLPSLARRARVPADSATLFRSLNYHVSYVICWVNMPAFYEINN